MKKLIQGIVNFRNLRLPEYAETFARLALGQKPDALFIACSDSRVAVNAFASTDPGDLFVVRNVGNLIPPCGEDGISTGDESEAAAIEFAITNLNISDIIVCGHSECGAMHAIRRGREHVASPHLKSWLRHGLPSLERLKTYAGPKGDFAEHNTLSQLNVLQQIDHLMTYELIRTRVAEGTLQLHGWWFDIAKADVYAYDEGKFRIIDEQEAVRLKKIARS
jgi:carbonic anhydrase